MERSHSSINYANARQREKNRRWSFLIKLAILAVLLFLKFRYPFFLEEKVALPSSVLSALYFYISTHLTISFIRLTLAAVYLKRRPGTTMGNNFLIGLNQIAGILNFIALVLAILFLFDIDPKEFFTSISIIAAAIAILFKDYITNIINGLIVMFSDYLSLNDYVSIGDHRGRIVDITLMNVHLLNDDDELIYIANNNIISSIIVNYTRKNQRKIIVEFSLPPHQIEDLNALEEELTLALDSFGEDLIAGSAQMRVVDVNSTAILLKFWVIVTRIDRRLDREIRRRLNSQIIKHLNQNRNMHEHQA